ncbi:MAG TPA: rhodanese-like domain-containing protein [Candidatus Paceibacterota bacterium]|nr:rhodanese-like domain-containing protein [Candidatus Paceibacterota bacterium]
MLDPVAMQEAMDLIVNNEAILIDVRTEEEWDEGHAQIALHIDVDDIENGMRPDVAKEMPIYLYSKAGQRAEHAKEILIDDGYVNVNNLGGLQDWIAIGGAVE